MQDTDNLRSSCVDVRMNLNSNNFNAIRNISAAKAQVKNLRRLASPFGQDIKAWDIHIMINMTFTVAMFCFKTLEVNYEFVALLSQLTCDYLISGQTVKILRRLAYEFELDQSQRKSTQVGGQTKCKLNVENV